jgi:hypothetical protein
MLISLQGESVLGSYRYRAPLNLTETHGIKEGDGRQTLNSVHVNEPLKVLLEDTIATLTVSSENSIQARLGGVGLPTAIKQADETITNLGNLVTVKKYTGDVIALLKLYPSVGRLPIATVSDGGIHLGFDLTHGLGLVDLLSMAPLEGIWGNPVPVPKVAHRHPFELDYNHIQSILS